MRQPQKSNRARGRGGRKSGGGGGGGNVLNRVYESAGPEGKVRGTPQQIVEKYLSLARDAQTSGDRVMSENFLQHAEHYQRIVLQALGAQEERRDNAGGSDSDDDDDDYGQGMQMAQRAPEPRQHGGGHNPANGRDHGTPSAPAAPAPGVEPVGSLTTIDLSEEDGQDLLVATEATPSPEPAQASQPQPAQPGPARRPRRPRTRRPAEGGETPSPDTDTAARSGEAD